MNGQGGFSIETSGLTKVFGDLTAVDSLDLQVKRGELFGLLGPNGAGKTTTISMLSTILQPTSGSGRVCAFDIKKQQDDVRRCIGIVFQDPSLDDELTARENLDFHGRLYDMPADLRKKRIKEVLELVGLYDRKDTIVKKYSGGMKRRLEIARGLMHHPRVLFLDEPTLGLDPQTRRTIWDYVKDLNTREGLTIILTTHYMDEADYLCDRVAIIDSGKIVTLDTPKQLKENLGGDVLKVQIRGDREKFKACLKKIPAVKSIMAENEELTLRVKEGEKLIPKLVEAARKCGSEVEGVSLHKPTLEDVFLHYTGKAIREEEGSSKDRMRLMRRMRTRGP